MKQENVTKIVVRLNVPTSNLRLKEDGSMTMVEISSEGFEVDVEPIHLMGGQLREKGVSNEISNKVHDAALDVLYQELGIEILKDFMPNYRD